MTHLSPHFYCRWWCEISSTMWNHSLLISLRRQGLSLCHVKVRPRCVKLFRNTPQSTLHTTRSLAVSQYALTARGLHWGCSAPSPHTVRTATGGQGGSGREPVKISLGRLLKGSCFCEVNIRKLRQRRELASIVFTSK